MPEFPTGQPTLILTRGLPASGKSTLARQWASEAPEHRVRVNRDDLRMELFSAHGLLGRSQEDAITEVQLARVAEALHAGMTVACDDTNLDDRHVDQWIRFAAVMAVPVVVVDVPTPVDECIRRDEERGAAGGRQVGEHVIRQLSRRYGYPRH